MLHKLLFSPDPAEGTSPPAPLPAPRGEGSTGAPPPAASTVVNSDVREGDAAEMVRLKREADEAKRLLKEREMRVNELEDNLRTLTAPPEPKGQGPKPKAERAPGWMDLYRAPEGDESEA